MFYNNSNNKKNKEELIVQPFYNDYDRFFIARKANFLYQKFDAKKKLHEKILESSKTFTVIAGSQRISNRIVSIVGNYNGIVGLGFGKSVNKIKARKLSFYKGRKELMPIPLTLNLSIPLFTWARYCASTIKLYPVYNFSGLKVGGPARAILEFAGIKNISAVKFGSSNLFNIANATILALRFLSEKIEQLVENNHYYKTFFSHSLLNARNFVK